jgi:hypothetical protein
LGQFHDLRWKHPRFWEFWGDYICGIFKGIFDGILILIHVYIYILLLLLLLIGSLMVSLMGYLILVLIHLCTYIYTYIHMLLIGFLQRNTTGIMVWHHQQYDISGMIEISTISHGGPRDVQHGPKKCWWS